MVRGFERAVSEPRSIFSAEPVSHEPDPLSSSRLHHESSSAARRGQAVNGIDSMRRPINTWTTEQRFALLVLQHCYRASWLETADIFNRIFALDLAKCGFSREGTGFNGLTRGALQSQFAEIRDQRHSCGYDAVAALASSPQLSDLQPPFNAVNNAITSTASFLEITLSQPGPIIKSLLPNKPHNLSKSQLRTRRKRDGSAMSDTEMSVIHESDSTSASPSKRPRGAPAKTSKLHPSVNNVGNSRPGTHVSSESQYHDGTPMLLFRAYNPNTYGVNSGHAFYSGLQPLGPAPKTDDDDLLKHAINHLNREESATPLISMTNSFAWVLRIAHQQLQGARIAVIEPRGLPAFYHVAPLCKKVKASGRANFVKGNRRSYTGELEFWAWREIPTAAIIADISLEALRRSANALTADTMSSMNGQISAQQTRSMIETVLSNHTKAEVAVMVASMIIIFFPVDRRRAYTLDLTRAIIISFNISTDLPRWLADVAVSQAFEAELNQAYQVKSLRPETTSQLHILRQEPESVTAISKGIRNERWSPGNSPLGTPSVTGFSFQDGLARASSLVLPSRESTPRAAVRMHDRLITSTRDTALVSPRATTTASVGPTTPRKAQRNVPGSLPSPPQTVRVWRLEEEIQRSPPMRKGLSGPMVVIPRIVEVAGAIQDSTNSKDVYEEKNDVAAEHRRAPYLQRVRRLPETVDLTEVDDDSEAETIIHDHHSESPGALQDYQSESEHERASLISSFGAGRRNIWTNPYSGR